jgi:hypothetical protein
MDGMNNMDDESQMYPSAIIKDVVYENENYWVRIVRVPDMFFDTYAIVNKKFNIIEQIHPNLFNVTKIADQFDSWLVNGADDDDSDGVLGDSLFGNLTPGGRSN